MRPWIIWIQATVIPVVLSSSIGLNALAQTPTPPSTTQIAQPPSSPFVKNHPELTLAGDQRVMAAALSSAARMNAPGASIAVVDAGGQLILLQRLDNTLSASANVAYGKAHTAALFRKNTNIFETSINGGRIALLNAIPDFTSLQGGIPIELNGQVVGAIGVSVSASAQQDEDIARAAVQVLGGGS